MVVTIAELRLGSSWAAAKLRRTQRASEFAGAPLGSVRELGAGVAFGGVP